MNNQEYQKEKKEEKIPDISRAFMSIYTGVFLIDLENDRFQTINSPDPITSMLKEFVSAQRAINFAIQNTVSEEELLDVLTFVNLRTLCERMGSEKCLSIDYKGIISGWVRGSFIEVERNGVGKVTKVLYTYQVIDEEKRKELENLKQLKESYVQTSNELKYTNSLSNIVMEQLTCGVIVYTIPGRNLLQINPEALRIMGWRDAEDAAENLEKNWKNVRIIDEVNEDKLFGLRKEQGSVKYQFLIKSEQGEEKRILAESKSFSGRYGGKVIISTLMDITQISTLEKEKNILEGQNTLLANENVELQRARDAVYTMLKTGSYLCTYAEDGETLLSIKFSDALRKLYGYSNEEEAPNTWDMWMKGAHPDDRKYVEESFLAALRDRTGKTPYSVEFRGVQKGGSVLWYRATGHVIRRKDGTAEYCYGVITDIDEQKKASDRLREAVEEAKRANEAKTVFLSRMSHDIRTPMNGIMGLIEINEKHAEDIAFTSQNRRKAKVAANHLLSLINDVLQLSKLEDSHIELTETPFVMPALLNDIYTITEMRAKDNGIDLRMDLDDSIRQYPYLWGSPLHIRQIYINLLGNAIKYNKKNGTILCRVTAEKTENHKIRVKVVIKDSGIGMSKEFQQHLFDPFAREHEEMTGKYEGTGLGLSIVKQLVDKMGGTIRVESEIGEGSCFTVEIPFTEATKEDVSEVETPEENGSIEGKNILLVEDNELNMDISEILLTDAGAKVTKAVNGQQALDLFRENEPGTFDLILMDVMMPVMNGYDATRGIRALNRADAKVIPIIAMTANAFAEDVEEAKRAGMTAHIGKPLNTQKMLSVITKCMKD